jgi:hypothetical protein
MHALWNPPQGVPPNGGNSTGQAFHGVNLRSVPQGAGLEAEGKGKAHAAYP